MAVSLGLAFLICECVVLFISLSIVICCCALNQDPRVELGYFPYSAEGKRAEENLVCAICLEVFEHGQECSEVPACRHLFHRDCIHAWMKNKSTCPLCRHDIEAGIGSEGVLAADDMV